jgi:pimeloyl-ACP methyl ester carboxylesterase
MLNYHVEGSGQTVVFIHGYGESSSIWNSLTEDLIGKYQCLSVDLPGFGLSDLNGPFGIPQMATAVKEVLTSQSIDSCVILGHSMGSYVALEFAHQYPAKVEGLGLIHSTAKEDTVQKKRLRLKTHDFISKSTLEAYSRLFAPMLLADDNRSNDKWIEGICQSILSGSKEGLMNATEAMMNRADRNHVYTELDIPYFFLGGRHDDLVPIYDMLSQAASCKRSMVAILEDAGHLSMVESPVKYKQVVKDYLLWVYR